MVPEAHRELSGRIGAAHVRHRHHRRRGAGDGEKFASRNPLRAHLLSPLVGSMEPRDIVRVVVSLFGVAPRSPAFDVPLLFVGSPPPWWGEQTLTCACSLRPR